MLTMGLLDYKKELDMQGGDVEERNAFATQIAEQLVEVKQLTGYHFVSEIPLETQLYQLYDQASRLCQEEESEEITAFFEYQRNGYSVKKEWFRETVKLPFENITVNAPVGYDEILKTSFRNYMTPVNYANHDYPFYKEEAKVMGEKVEIMDMQYKMGVENMNLQIIPNSADLQISAEEAKEKLPLEWWEKIYPLNEQGQRVRKKVLLYYTSVSTIMAYSATVIEKLRYVFNIMKENPDVVLWWFPCSFEEEHFHYVHTLMPELVEEYRELVEEYKQQSWGIYDASGDISRAIAMCDAYYGDECLVSEWVQKTGKYIMYQDYEIV